MFPFEPLYNALGKPTITELVNRTSFNTYSFTKFKKNGLSVDDVDLICEVFFIAPYEIYEDWFSKI